MARKKKVEKKEEKGPVTSAVLTSIMAGYTERKKAEFRDLVKEVSKLPSEQKKAAYEKIGNTLKRGDEEDQQLAKVAYRVGGFADQAEEMEAKIHKREMQKRTAIGRTAGFETYTKKAAESQRMKTVQIPAQRGGGWYQKMREGVASALGYLSEKLNPKERGETRPARAYK